MTVNAVAGHFVAALDPYGTPLSLGKTQNGFRFEYTPALEAVTADNLGPETVQEYIGQGGNVFLSFELIEWHEAGVDDLLTMYMGGNEGAITNIGCPIGPAGGASAPNKDIQLQLADGVYTSYPTVTKCGGAIANFTPSVYHAQHAVLAPNASLEWALNNRLRVLPVRLQLLPGDHSGGSLGGPTNAWYMTNPTTRATGGPFPA